MATDRGPSPVVSSSFVWTRTFPEIKLKSPAASSGTSVSILSETWEEIIEVEIESVMNLQGTQQTRPTIQNLLPTFLPDSKRSEIEDKLINVFETIYIF